MLDVDLDLTVLDDLDFTLQCETKTPSPVLRHWVPCPDEATHWMRFWCKNCGNRISFSCAKHASSAAVRGGSICRYCNDYMNYICRGKLKP